MTVYKAGKDNLGLDLNRWQLKPNVMKLRIISLFFLFAAVVLSCNKEEPLVTTPAYIPVLSKVLIDNQPYYEYLYNAGNLISEELSRFDLTVHHYNTMNQLVSSDYSVDNAILNTDIIGIETIADQSGIIDPDQAQLVGTVNYEYSNNKLIKSVYSRPTEGNSEYSEFSYSGSDRIKKRTLYWEDKIVGYIEYSYDSKGNIIVESLYNVGSTGVSELSTTTKYEFDSNPNPYKSFNKLMMPGINTNVNNIIKETYTIPTSDEKGGETILVTQYSYVYDALGYPILKDGNIVFSYI
jgi:hypothetical protein